MSQTCKTVTVKADNEQGCMVINESDFDAEVHHLFGDEPTKKAPTSAPPAWANTPYGKHVILGEMTKEELHALAKQYGVEVHHKAGVDKLIEALQSAFAVK